MVEVGFKKWIITITVILAALLELVDTTIVNVSIPQIMGNLGATLEEAAWITTGYAVANVVVLPMSGWLGSRFGRKRYFIASIILFTIASFLCGNATSLLELIIFRIVQGMAGGGLLSTSQSILIETWPKEQIGTATALFGLGAVVGPTVGPTIGGYITDHFSWPWIFYVNIPLGAIAAYFSYIFIRKTPKNDKLPIDWWGIILLALAVGSLQTILEKGEGEDWFATGYIIVLTITSVAGFILFIWRELSTKHPIVNFSILKNRDFSVGMLTSFLLGFGLYGSVFIFPIFCQTLLQFSAQQTGEILFPGGVMTIIMMPFIGKMLQRGVPAQFMATVGMALFFVFSVMLGHSTLLSGIENFFWPLIIRGAAMALLFVPVTTLALQSLRGEEIGQGTGLNNMMRQLGGSFGIAALTTIIHIRSNMHRSILIEHASNTNSAYLQRMDAMIANFMSKGYSYLDAYNASLKAIDGTITKQSFLLTYSDAYWITGIMMLCAIPFLYLQRINRKPIASLSVH